AQRGFCTKPKRSCTKTLRVSLGRSGGKPTILGTFFVLTWLGICSKKRGWNRVKMSLLAKYRGKKAAAFLLTEDLIAMPIGGIALAALFAGLSWGMSMIKQTRENERATQLLLSKIELFRLYTWTQLDPSSGYVPSRFTNYFVEGATNSGTVYFGQV